MSRHLWHRVNLPLHLVIFFGCLSLSQELIQNYCSSFNTGSYFSVVEWKFQSLGHCQQDICGPAGYAYAIIQYKNCWCSNYAPADTVSVSQCSEPCPGYPQELCGNLQDGLFGYIDTGKGESLGTQGSEPAPGPVKTPTPEVHTVYKTLQQTTILTRTRVESYPNTRATQGVKTITQKETKVMSHVVPVTVTRPGTTYSTSLSVFTTVEVTTVSGTPVTVTAVETASSQESFHPVLHETQKGLSNGAVAGIVIGAIAGFAAVVGILLYFFCWRPRRRDNGQNDGDNQGINRNTSVLSKVGLLRNNSQAGPTRSPYLPTNIVSSAAPRIDTAILPSSAEPSSAVSRTTMESRRNSRPMFVDTRLNPHALMEHNNASHTSVGTLQDNQDYSRPLEVRNPDP